MPRKYTRKVGARPRAEWTQEEWIAAMDEIRKGVLGINEISRKYGIPTRTLRRRFAEKNTEEQTLGKQPVLDFVNEKRLVRHILKLDNAGFPPTRDIIQRLAFKFAEKLGNEAYFDKETRKAGPQWLKSFLERNTELCTRQDKGFSNARAKRLLFINQDKGNEMPSFLLNHKRFLQEKYMVMTPNLLDETQDPLDENQDPLHESWSGILQSTTSKKDSFNTNDTPKSSPNREETVKIELSPEPTPEVDEREENGEDRTLRSLQKSPSTQDCSCNTQKLTVKCDGVNLLFLGYAGTFKRLSRRNQAIVNLKIAKAFLATQMGDIQENK